MFVEYLLLNSIAGITDLEKQKRHLLCSGKTFWLAKKIVAGTKFWNLGGCVLKGTLNKYKTASTNKNHYNTARALT